MGDRGPSLPEQFGKYSILGHLATGGMAEVYVARQAGLQGFEKVVVIKRIRPELNTDPRAIEAFLDEARLVATLEHPNIAPVSEIGFVNGSYFFVMEFVHGADLRKVLARSIRARRELSLADALYLIIDVCKALHYAHEKRGRDGQPLELIHRDVTPSNVLVSFDGSAKVCDFGIAKAGGRSSETQRGVVKGKFSYMSPEQCQGRALDRRSDIFAIGILLYELTTQTQLFRGPSEYEVMRKIVEGEVPLPATVKPGYPPELEGIVMRALARDAGARHATAQELQSALEDFAREARLKLSSIHVAQLMHALFDQSDAFETGSGKVPRYLVLGTGRDIEPGADTEVLPASMLRGRASSRSAAAPAAGRGLGGLLRRLCAIGRRRT